MAVTKELIKPMKRYASSIMKSLVITSILLVSALPLLAQGQVTMIELNRSTPPNGSAMFPPSLPPIPVLPAFPGAPALVPTTQIPTTTPSIQATPEPSSFAIVGLAFGLLAIRRMCCKVLGCLAALTS